MAKNINIDENLDQDAIERTAEGIRVERDSEDSSDILAVKAEIDEDDDNWWKDDEEYTDSRRQELQEMYDKTLKMFVPGDIIRGLVVGKNDREVMLNVGYKSEATISSSEFRDAPDLKIGDTVEVFVEKTEGKGGELVLSRKAARRERTWERILSALNENVILEGQVMRRTKGGFVVDIQGIEAFLPGSQIDVRPVKDFDQYVGRIMEFKVVKINHIYQNVVVSHKILIEEKIEDQRQEILKNLEKGQVLEGTVKNMTPFGVFIDLGGVDGLLHITDISWGRVNHPNEVLKMDDKVNVVVLDFDEEKKRISLGMKQLTSHPWETLDESVVEGVKVKGRVVTVTDYGIFIEIKPGVEGLIHTSEMSWSQHAKNPTEQYKPGQEVEAVILNIDRDERKMSLGLKQLTSDPWTLVDAVAQKYAIGSKHTGIVRNMTTYGLFVELEDGVDGLVHISDLSWTKKFGHPSEYVKIEDSIEVVVLSIDIESRKLSLGHKQLTEDIWDTFADEFTIGSIQLGVVRRVDAKGAIVELKYGVEGYCPSKFLKVPDGQSELEADIEAEFEVVEFSKETKRITLSHSAVWQKNLDPTEKPAKKSRAKKETIEDEGEVIIPEKKDEGSTLGENEALSQLKAKMDEQAESKAEESEAKDE